MKHKPLDKCSESVYYETVVTQHRNLKEIEMETQPTKTPNFTRLIAEIRTITGINDFEAEALREFLKAELNEVFTYAYDSGRDEGLAEGYTDGQDYGYSVGHSEGYSDGYSEGHSEGYYDGRYADQRPRQP